MAVVGTAVLLPAASREHGVFIYTLLRSMFLTLWNDGIVWRGTKYPLEELRKGMV